MRRIGGIFVLFWWGLALCPALGAAETGLAAFAGVWTLNQELSQPLSGSLTARPEDFKGLRLILEADGRLRAEWPGGVPKIHRLKAIRLEPQRASVRLEGFEPVLLLEKKDPNQLRLTDREETLVFDRVRTGPAK
ncbi:MAG: hypothetical protein FWF99_00485 [Desulfovibrionaceae bacterium]|nr:hypothetical protein [Desulfovibrionaceae bacterium]